MYQMLCENELTEYLIQKSNIHHHDYSNKTTTTYISSVNEWIASAFDKAGTDDLILFYFTGHGSADKDTLASMGISLSSHMTYTWKSLTDALCATGSNHIIVIMDSCYSGGLITHIQNNLPDSDKGRFSVLTASSDSQESTSKSFYATLFNFFFYGRFTYYLGEGIGFVDDVLHADTEGADGKITLRELHEYVSRKVVEDKENKKKPMNVQIYPPVSSGDQRLNTVLFEYHATKSSINSQISTAGNATPDNVNSVVSTLKETNQCH